MIMVVFLTPGRLHQLTTILAALQSPAPRRSRRAPCLSLRQMRSGCHQPVPADRSLEPADDRDDPRRSLRRPVRDGPPLRLPRRPHGARFAVSLTQFGLVVTFPLGQKLVGSSNRRSRADLLTASSAGTRGRRAGDAGQAQAYVPRRVTPAPRRRMWARPPAASLIALQASPRRSISRGQTERVAVKPAGGLASMEISAKRAHGIPAAAHEGVAEKTCGLLIASSNAAEDGDGRHPARRIASVPTHHFQHRCRDRAAQ